MPEVIFPGPEGRLEGRYHPQQMPDAPIAIILHPDPQFGGTMNNRVVYNLHYAFHKLGFTVLRFNFRGVGQSAGAHDEGRGETQDLLQVVAQLAPQGPLCLAGFSFGGYVAAMAHARLVSDDAPQSAAAAPSQLVLVSPATSRFEVPPVPAHTLVVQGEQDDVVPLTSVLDWARPQGLPVTVVPGTGHFFHGQLALLREVVLRDKLRAILQMPSEKHSLLVRSNPTNWFRMKVSNYSNKMPTQFWKRSASRRRCYWNRNPEIPPLPWPPPHRWGPGGP